jgi:hypothetical protein
VPLDITEWQRADCPLVAILSGVLAMKRVPLSDEHAYEFIPARLNRV